MLKNKEIKNEKKNNLQIYKGIFWKIISCICFSLINVLVKYLSGGSSIPIKYPIPIYTIIIFSYTLGSLIMFPKFISLNNLKTKNQFLHILRIITATAGIFFWYLGLQFMPIIYVIIISCGSYIITILMSIIFLKEKIDIKRWFALIISLLGITFIINSKKKSNMGKSFQYWKMFLPLISAISFSIDKILSRKLIILEKKPFLLTFYLLISIGPICLFPSIINGWIMPKISHIPWLIILSFLTIFSNYTYSKAYVFIEVTVLMPFSLPIKFIINGIIEYIIFKDIPKTSTIIIGFIIILINSFLVKNKKT